MRPAYLIILLVLNFFWAASLSAYKVINPYLEPGGIVTLRFGLAALPFLAVWPWLPGAAPRGKDLLKTCLMGLIVFTVGHRLQVLGNKLGTASNSSILMAVEPLISVLAAAIFLHEHIGPRRVMGFAFGILGVLLLNGVWRSDFKWTGLAASLIFVSSFFAETTYTVLGKKIINAPTEQGRVPISPIKLLTLALLTGTVANLLLEGSGVFVAAGRMSAQAWWLLLGIAIICTTVGYSFWFVVIKESDVNVAALTLYSQPVFGVLMASIWLGESLHWGQLWGSLAIVAGLVIGLSRQIKRPATSGPAHSA